MTVLWDAFFGRTGGLGPRPAVIAPDGDLSFGELWHSAERIGSSLRAGGLAEGATVALLMPNGRSLLPAALGIWSAGATLALLTEKIGRVELGALARGVGLTAVVTQPGLAERISASLPVGRIRELEGLVLLECRETEKVPARASAAVLKFSSGSTATPKGIALSAGNVLAEADNVAAALALEPGDRILAAVPLTHSYGFDLGALQTLAAGTTLVLEAEFVPRRELRSLASGEVSVFLGVPAQYRVLLATPIATPPTLAAARWLLSCTAPLAPDVVTAFHERFGGIVCQHYGSSETGAVANHLPEAVLARPASVGRAIPGVEIRIRGDDGTERPVGAEGEIVVQSPAVAQGYVAGAPPGESPFGDHTFAMGDLGFLDADGFLTVTGRSDSLINVGGLKVSPAEVVAVLERHPAVREAAVTGVPDGRGEAVVYAAVVLDGPADEADLIAHCRAALAEHKVPRRLDVRADLPRTATGKVRLQPEDLR